MCSEESECGCEPNARLLRRKTRRFARLAQVPFGRVRSLGRLFAAQQSLAQDDSRIFNLQICLGMEKR